MNFYFSDSRIKNDEEKKYIHNTRDITMHENTNNQQSDTPEWSET